FLAKSLATSHRPIIRRALTESTTGPYAEKLFSELNPLHAEIVFPMVIKGKTNGFIVIGAKRSGDRFTAEDINLLRTLSRQSALAVENALAYEKISALNKNLEQKVAARTRSLKDALIEKEKTQELLIRSESLAAIGQLVAGVAHEINNPLASVKSLIQSTIEDLNDLCRQVPIEKELIDDLRFADKELERAKEIVRSLLDLSRQTQTYTETVNFNLVVTNALRILHNQYKTLPVMINKDLCDPLPEVQGNFANLGQVVINIIKNAIQAAIATSGSISLTTRYDENRQELIFECRDTGPGISDVIQDDIFKPFFTTKEVGQGTGLGLYICHEIIKKHGGKITFTNNNKAGTTFTVSLPAKADQSS
ncbi:sensor histidine kinase, partial [Thermodesulfobacteriota bacterium]